MAQNITVGIDIGTSTTKVIVAEYSHERDHTPPKIISTGIAETKGMRHGYIMSIGDVVKSVKQAVRMAEKSGDVEIKKAFLAVGGIGLASTMSASSVIVSRGDSEITDLDVKKAMEQSEADLPSSASLNRKIINAVPIAYKIDGKPVLGRPQGMKGMKLESKTLFITSVEQHISDLVQVLDEIGIEVKDVTPAPLAASLVTLSKTQKVAGCVLANIGAETVSISVFENNIPISLEVFPLGSIDITHDIALGLKISLEEAESIKIGALSDTPYSKKKLDEIIEARLEDIFEVIESHLKKIGRSGLLPAGIIMTGGGSAIADIEEVAKSTLRLPAKVSHFQFDGDPRGVRTDAWSVASGLIILGAMQEKEPSYGKRMLTGTSKTVLGWIRRFLP